MTKNQEKCINHRKKYHNGKTFERDAGRLYLASKR